MSSPIRNVSQLVKSIQYTGSNSADIVAQVPNVSITSESGGVLVLDFNGTPLTLNTTDWILFSINGTFPMSNTQFLAEWSCCSLCEELEELGASVEDTFVQAVGMAPVPTLLLGQDTTVNVNLQPAMPDTSFSAYATTFGGVNLADLDVTSVSVVDTDTVAVAVDNTGIGTISGATIMVHAIG